MSRYIDADALKESLEESYRAAVNCSELAKTEEIRAKSSWIEVTLLEAILRVDDAPTANVRENVKGEWVEYDNSHCECPFCHKEWSYFENMVEYFNYCPHCGADMRGGTEDV